MLSSFNKNSQFSNIMRLVREEGVDLPNLNEAVKEIASEVKPAPQNMKTVEEPEVTVEDLDLEDYSKEDNTKKVVSKSKKDPRFSIKELPKKLANQELKDSKVQEDISLNTYIVKVKHDKGISKIKTTASNEKAAKDKIMKAEGCPLEAIESVTLIKESKGDLYICNNCFKTFRNTEDSCIHCYSNIVERIVTKEESKVQETGSRFSGYRLEQRSDGKWDIMNGEEVMSGPYDTRLEAILQKEEYEDANESKVNEEKNFKVGDKVVSEIFGKWRSGRVKNIHDLGDMADVDFGNGDIYGIHFNRLEKAPLGYKGGGPFTESKVNEESTDLKQQKMELQQQLLDAQKRFQEEQAQIMDQLNQINDQLKSSKDSSYDIDKKDTYSEGEVENEFGLAESKVNEESDLEKKLAEKEEETELGESEENKNISVESVLEILGCNRAKWELQNMKRALSMMGGWFNSEEDNKRLEATKWALRNWNAYAEACGKYRDKKFSGR